jgi:Uma2 family endonuclease
MSSSAIAAVRPKGHRLPVLLDGIPIMYEDDDEGDMGEANIHVETDMILHICLGYHFANRPKYKVYSNLNLYYDPRAKKKQPYVSPDCMVVEPTRELEANIASYWLGKDGPAPLFTAEILSQRSFQQQDLGKKLKIYARLGIPEYALVDVTGELLPERLLLKILQPNRQWRDVQDPDGGITSQLGFRLVIDGEDGDLRVVHAQSGRPYLRPLEAVFAAGEAKRLADELKGQVERAREVARQLEAGRARLRKSRKKRKL